MKDVTAGRIMNHLFILYEDEIPEILHETNGRYRAAEEKLELLTSQLFEKYSIPLKAFDEIMSEIRTLRDLDNQLAYSLGVRDGIRLTQSKPEEIAINLHDDLQH